MWFLLRADYQVAASAKLSVVLGDKGLTERVVNVL